ncbi:putative diacyglycerol O-acyltransferase Mb3154c [Panulirus ornatus]|uniref:putative diacyglycerol O-acyltransferase Mb3154c n=1 Tax=Panulirus ornatus TaxID=150431 RepID=UPI003A86417D
MSLWSGWWCWVVAVSQSVVGVTIVVAMLPLVVPVLILLWVWRFLALLLVRGIHGHGAHVASGMEALFALDSAGARAVISAAAVLRGQVSVAAVRKIIAERITDARDESGRFRHPKFRQVVEKRCGVVVWMWADNFHVDSHVRQLQVNCRPRLFQDENDVLNEMSARTNLPFVRGQARWEVLLAPLKKFDTSKNSEEEWTHTVVLMRLHHALGDGRSVVGLIVTALVDPPMPDPRPSLVARRSWSGCAGRYGRLLWAFTNLPWVVIRVLTRGDSSLLHGCKLDGEKFLAWSPPLSLAAVKRGRALAGVSVNDLLLAGLSGALFRHFKEENAEVPRHVMTVLPLDVTAPGTPISLANRISLCTVPLPTSKMSRYTRLMTVHRRLNILKSSPDVLVNYVALDLISNLLPTPLARRALCTHGVTMVASNMPGPQEQINLFGEPVDDLMFWIPNKSRTGLGVSMLSYCGTIRVGLNVDSALIPTRDLAQRVMEDLVSEVNGTLSELMPTEATKPEEVHYQLQDDTESGGSDLTLIATHSTDEYDDGSGIGIFTYSDLQEDSYDTRKLDESSSSLPSDDLCPSESQHLLGRGFRSSMLFAKSLIKSDTDIGKSYRENKHHRFAHSDINIKISDSNQVQDR